MSKSRLTYLLHHYFEGNCSEKENDELMVLLSDKTTEEEVNTIMDQIWKDFNPKQPVFSLDQSSSIFDKIRNAHPFKFSKPIQNKRRWLFAAAAVFLLFIGSITLKLLVFNTSQVDKNLISEIKQDIPPGGNKAVLTLSDGSTIILDSAANGNLANQGNSSVNKLGNQIFYKTEGKSTEVLYNTISTPRGGKYQLALTDGTKVWLNAASSIRFPVTFVGKERKVEITGEAYFEVAKNKSMPFRVSVNDMNIEVLGTHFNISAYADERIVKTTLIEGSVKVTKGDALAILLPGEQARLSQQGQLTIDKDINIEEVVAWNNGLFLFDHNNIQEIMQQISKWYDVDVVFQGEPTHLTFSGVVSRNSNISQVLKIMEQAGVRFAIEGKKITVMK